MMNRSTTSSVTGRASAMRRMRRRTASTRLFCSTNGCPSLLELAPDGKTASCKICGFVRQVH
jgi:hypothetical protein